MPQRASTSFPAPDIEAALRRPQALRARRILGMIDKLKQTGGA